MHTRILWLFDVLTFLSSYPFISLVIFFAPMTILFDVVNTGSELNNVSCEISGDAKFSGKDKVVYFGGLVGENKKEIIGGI